ncbi:hypothetical protein QMK19_41500, partial [Streptomyces sp. H10-C2]|uniref:DUF5655 domain-containing protein n=1 Tax=unclassified Streptomyces TaxID=2593676 RepID=UPI0032D56CBD|nr:hypothetical protein [Streptomyces sp. PH10-H1]MDJ0375868.1 hypothetical protein [Streptomyces sp. H10-C2]
QTGPRGLCSLRKILVDPLHSRGPSYISPTLDIANGPLTSWHWSIDLVRYRLFGSDLLGLETVASVSGGTQAPRRARRQAVARAAADVPGASMIEVANAVGEALFGLGDGVNCVERKQYRAYQRLRNFACVCPPQRSKLLVYLKVDPKHVDLVPGFTRDVSGLGHHGTGEPFRV